MGSVHEAVFKVRCSRGLKVARYLGPTSIFGRFGAKTEDEDVEEMMDPTSVDANRPMALADTSTSFCVSFDYAETKGTAGLGDVVYIQAALLYSDPLTRTRRVRVHNLSLATAGKPPDIYRGADVEASFAAIFKNAIADSACFDAGVSLLGVSSPKSPPPGRQKWSKARDNLVDKAINVLMEYRVSCAPKSPSGQLILPESVKLLPLLCLGALKGILLRDDAHNRQKQQRGPGYSVAAKSSKPGDAPSLGAGAGGTTPPASTNGSGPHHQDQASPPPQSRRSPAERIAVLGASLGLPAEELVRIAYPRLYELPASSDDGEIVSAVATAADSIKPDRSYLLDTGLDLRIYVGPEVDAARKEEVDAIFDGDWLLRDTESSTSQTTPEADRLRAHCSDLAAFRSFRPPVTLVTPDTFDDFSSALVEDKSVFGTSYVDFLCSIHREIQTRMQNSNFSH